MASIDINCAICHEELNEPGAIFLSPPDRTGKVLRSDMCRRCWTLYQNTEVVDRSTNTVLLMAKQLVEAWATGHEALSPTIAVHLKALSKAIGKHTGLLRAFAKLAEENKQR